MLGTECGERICIASTSTLTDRSGALFAPSELNLVAHRYTSPYTDETTSSYEIRLHEPNTANPDQPNGLLTITLTNGIPMLDQDYVLAAGTTTLEDGGTAQIGYVAEAGRPVRTATVHFRRFSTEDGEEIQASFDMTCTDGQKASGSFDGTLYGAGARVPCTADTADACALYIPESICLDSTTVGYFTDGKCGSDGVCTYTRQEYSCDTGECTNGGCPIVSTPAF